MPMTAHAPSERDAAALIERHLATTARTITRFPTGLAHWAYDIETVDGRRVVARLGRRDHVDDFAGAVYWHGRLAPRGVPLPGLLAADPHPADGAFPFLLLERLPGVDLGDVYPELTPSEKRDLVLRIVEVRRAVAELPPGPGFKYAGAHDDRLRYTPGKCCSSFARSRSCGVRSCAIAPFAGVSVLSRRPARA